jgi:hypothetical protein
LAMAPECSETLLHQLPALPSKPVTIRKRSLNGIGDQF